MVFVPPSSNATDGAQTVCLAVVTGVHGIRGHVRLKTFLDDPLDLLSYETFDQDGQSLIVDKIVSGEGDKLVAQIKGIQDRNQAEALKGRELHVERDKLPSLQEEGTYYQADLIGLRVVDGGGVPLGHVRAVHNFGAGDLLEIDFATPQEMDMFPFVEAIFPRVDMEKGEVTLVVPATVEASDETGEAQ